jgi:hypothetical protein
MRSRSSKLAPPPATLALDKSGGRTRSGPPTGDPFLRSLHNRRLLPLRLPALLPQKTLRTGYLLSVASSKANLTNYPPCAHPDRHLCMRHPPCLTPRPIRPVIIHLFLLALLSRLRIPPEVQSGSVKTYPFSSNSSLSSRHLTSTLLFRSCSKIPASGARCTGGLKSSPYLPPPGPPGAPTPYAPGGGPSRIFRCAVLREMKPLVPLCRSAWIGG